MDRYHHEHVRISHTFCCHASISVAFSALYRFNHSYTNILLFVLESECFSENLELIDGSSSTVQLPSEKLEDLPPWRRMKCTI
ncbi:hypothetical protein XELAEV_18006496mg [Xenopus laevis]|uniref:Uncharacterized protein n=1 Tax=Xenopus laevis TaxID=8355 RepID=A0A974E1A4_XENLA|nr:hypothetical protein XELAEV_18006496mg [Xenopus laevis]